METLLTTLPWIQISLAVILTVAILMQQRGAGLGGAFGGSDGSIHYERRGSERTLFKATVAIAILFVLSTFVEMVIAPDAPPTDLGDGLVDVVAEEIDIENIDIDASSEDIMIEEISHEDIDTSSNLLDTIAPEGLID